MVSCAAIATIARGSMPAEAASVTNVAPSPASGLPARLSIASMPAASVGAMHDMVADDPDERLLGRRDRRDGGREGRGAGHRRDQVPGAHRGECRAGVPGIR